MLVLGGDFDRTHGILQNKNHHDDLNLYYLFQHRSKDMVMHLYVRNYLSDNNIHDPWCNFKPQHFLC